MNNWDKYFLEICNVVASNSKCLSRKVGAIVVQDKSIVSTGYNGPPRGVPSCSNRYWNDLNITKNLNGIKFNQDKCPRQTLGFKSGEALDLCVAGHGERNAIINAAREGVKVKGGIMYMNCGISCTPCLVEIINAGISEIVVTEMTCYDRMAEYLIFNSKLKVRKFDI